MEENKIDWSETDRLMEQLRAKINDEEQKADAPQDDAPQESAPNVPDAPPAEESVPVTQAIEVEEFAPVDEPSSTDSAQAPEQRAPAQKKPRTPRKRVPKFNPEEWEEQQARKMAENPLHTRDALAERNARRRADLLQGEDWNTSGPVYTDRPARAKAPKSACAASKTEQEKRSRSDVTQASPAVRPRHAQKAAKQERERAAVTVEELMQDLFGDTGANGGNWFPNATAAEKQTAPGVSDSASEQELLTVTNERDGQIALVLPEADVVQPQAQAEEEMQADDAAVESTIDEAQVNLFSLLSVESPRLSADSLPETDSAEDSEGKMELKRSVESSKEELELLLELDYEDELGNVIGFEKIRDYHELGMNGQAVVRRRRRKAGETREYEMQGQDISLRRAYAERKRGYIVQLSVAVALTVILFIYERASWMAALFGGPFDGAAYPVSYILFGLQILLIGTVFCHRRLMDGFLRLVRFSPIDDSLCSVLVLVTFGYHFVLLFVPHTGYPSLYLSPAAGGMALLALSDLLEWHRESLAFQVISSRKQKYALIERVSVGGKQNSARAQLLETAHEQRLWYVRPVGFVRNYFANTGKRVEHTRSLGAQLLLIAAISAALGLYVFAVGGTFAAVMQTAFLAFLFCLPTVLLLITSLPMFLAACLRLRRKGAIVGEEPVYACGEPTALVMPDSETFAEMKNEQFEFVGNADVRRVSVLVRALLEKVQSPLMHTVEVDRSMRLEPEAITLTEIDEQGVAAVVGEEQTPMLMGSVEYLQKYGIRVRPRAGVAFDELSRRLLCVAIDGEVTALFLVRYRLTVDMLTLLEELQAEDVQMLVRTKDPGVHNELFVQLRPDAPDPVKVMKPTATEMDIRTDRVDATIVALGSCTEAARTFVTCRRVRRAALFGKLFQFGSIVMGAVLSILLTLFGRMGGVPAVLVTLWLLLFCGIHALTSFFYLRERDPDDK